MSRNTYPVPRSVIHNITGADGEGEFTGVVKVRGVQAAGIVGAVTVIAVSVATVLVTGVEATGSVGDVVASIPQTVAVTGVEASGEAGSVEVTSPNTVTVTGVTASGVVGSVQVSGEANLSTTGLEATGEVGSVNAGAGLVVLVTGLEGTGDVGTATVEGIGNVSVTGVGATGATSQVTVVTSSDVDVPVTGVAATGNIGSVTVEGIGNVSVTGLAATGNVGSVTVVTTGEIDVPVTGVAATGNVGSVTVDLGVWEYASLAAAESSGDSWIDGDDVQITGGALFIYSSSLAVDSYSGLIHKYPYDGTGTLGEYSSITSTVSTAQGVDPDTWTGWTQTTVGGGTADTSGGRSRFNSPTTNDSIKETCDTTLGSTDNETFLIVPLVSAGFAGVDSSGGQRYAHWELRADRTSDSNQEQIAFGLHRITSTTLWNIQTAATSFTATTKSVATERRAWMYRKEGRFALWFDGDATPEVSGTTTWSVGDTTLCEGGSNSGGTSTAVYNKFLQVVAGVMETA